MRVVTGNLFGCEYSTTKIQIAPLQNDTFASICSKMATFKRQENYPKDMQNSLSFHQLIDLIGEASEWVLVTKFPVVLKIRAVKVGPFHFYFIKQVLFLHFQLWLVVKSVPVKIFEPKLFEKLFPSMQEVIDEKMRKFTSFR